MLLFEFFRRHPLPQSPESSQPMAAGDLPPQISREISLAQAVGEQAASLFSHRKLYCAEAILVAVNAAFGEPLTEDQAINIAAGLTVGLGDRGCLCGAVAGACIAVGAVCAPGEKADSRAAIRQESAAIHEAFVSRHKSACCRVLTKPVKDDPAAHVAQCARLTGFGAELAVRSILRVRPELATCPQALRRGKSPLCSRIKWLLSFFCR